MCADVFPADFVTMQDQVIQGLRLEADADLTKTMNWLNNTYFTACIETNFYENGSSATALAVNATSVSVPTGIVKIEYIVPTGSDGTNWGPMMEVTFEELLEIRAYQGGAQSTGAPSRYAFRSSGAPSIEFWPNAIGGEILTFYGLSMPDALEDDEDVPIFPEPYSQVIVYGALVKAAEFKKDLLMLQTYEAKYQDWLSRLRAFNNVKVGAQVQQLRVAGARPWPSKNDIDRGY